MQRVKYIVFISFTFLNTNLLLGQQKLFDSILEKAQKNVDKNYYSDSISAVRHSEYVVNDSTNEFEKVVCIEYFPTPMWAIDGKYYQQKYGFNNSIFSKKIIGYLITAKLYKKEEANNPGFTHPHRFGSSYSHIDIYDFNSVVSTFVWDNKTKREEAKNNSETNLPNLDRTHSFDTDNQRGDQKSKGSIEYGYINDKKISNGNSVSTNNLPQKITMQSAPIYRKVSDSTFYKVENIIYNETDCYQLTKTIKKQFVYTDAERKRLEEELINGGEYSYSNLIKGEYLSEQKKNEFRQLVEYWAGGSIVTESYIIAKKNFAVISFNSEYQQQNSQGQWIEGERITEKYQEGKDKKYHQTYYLKLVRNYTGGFLNTDNILTLEIRTPIDKVFSLDSTKSLINDNNISIMSLFNTRLQNSSYIKYEDFCERVDLLDDAMLLDWNNYEK
ncbi:MAG: hypothetical protein LBE91_00075 [Tannerella sp.]|jgi:hypothetical protein|nr:hypothetical protein [Tannerella sp.]